MAEHDPLVILGFLLIGAFVVFFFHVQFKMRETGLSAYAVFVSSQKFSLPTEYLKIRKQRGWSPWPAYLVWPCLLAGIVLLVIGVYRM